MSFLHRQIWPAAWMFVASLCSGCGDEAHLPPDFYEVNPSGLTRLTIHLDDEVVTADSDLFLTRDLQPTLAGQFHSEDEQFAAGGSLNASVGSCVPTESGRRFPTMVTLFVRETKSANDVLKATVGILPVKVARDGRHVEFAGPLSLPEQPGRYELYLGLTGPIAASNRHGNDEASASSPAPPRFLAKWLVEVE